MNDYIKQLEEQNEELKQKLANYEQVAELRKFAGMRYKVANSILTSYQFKVTDNGSKVQGIQFQNQTIMIAGHPEVQVDVHLTYQCDDNGEKIMEFIKELSNATDSI
jgi:predicted DNA binding CopG/RHH family protein